MGNLYFDFELRIGNWVFDKSRYKAVIISCGAEIDDAFDKYDPIPLFDKRDNRRYSYDKVSNLYFRLFGFNEEVESLPDMFEEPNGGYYYSYWKKIDNLMSIMIHEDGEAHLFKPEEGTSIKNSAYKGINLHGTSGDPGINYVHQLQNLYYAIKGEELTACFNPDEDAYPGSW